MSEGFINTFAEYQDAARKTAIFPWHLSCLYPALGLCGETGEVAEIIKKIHRDRGGQPDTVDREKLELELGDVLWYLSNLASDLGLDLQTIAEKNLAKLASRQQRGTLHGSGDNR